jgi:hypothetical protein
MLYVRNAPHWKPLLGLLNGGLDQACEAAFGAETRWVSDIDPGACKILAHRYPDLPNHGDITKIDWTAVEPVDILTGGYPCQPFSHAGRRGGTNNSDRDTSSRRTCEVCSVPKPIAVWSPARGVWEVPETENLICEHSDVFSETWPSSGTTRNGWAYAQPTWVPRTDGSESSSLLPTPDVPTGGEKIPPGARQVGSTWLRADGTKVQVHLSAIAEGLPTLPTPRASRGASGTETMYALGGERSDEGRTQGEVLLRTPTAQLAVNGGSQHPDKRKAGGHGPTLADEVEHLLPTPTSRDGKGANQRGDATCLHGALLPTPTAMGSKASGGSSPSDVTLTDAVVRTRLGAVTNPRFADGSERLIG